MKSSKILFSAKSMLDDFGRVFYYDDKIYRAIHPDKKEYCLNLINSDLFRELLNKNYIPQTKIADFSIEGYELVLEHEKLTETLQHEWSFGMLKDAALMVLDVNEICNKYGYELKDSHTLNVFFRGVQPVWIDIGSIYRLDENQNYWRGFNEFIGSFVIPLLFWSENNFYVSRKLLESNFHRVDMLPSQNILENDLIGLLKKSPMVFELKFGSKEILKTHSENKIIQLLTEKINQYLKQLTFGNKREVLKYQARYLSQNGLRKLINETQAPQLPSAWQNYHNHYYTGNGVLKSSERFEKVVRYINELGGEINSAIDLAGNQGLLCTMIANQTKVEKIILTDYDSNAIESAFQNFKEKKIDNIIPVLLNFMFTSDIKGTAQRLKSNLALALAVTHHLILTNKFSIESVFERIKSYSNKYVMIEFMPLGLWEYDSENFPPLPAWYKEEWFSVNFNKYFSLIKKEKLEENRILFFGRVLENNS